VSVWTSKTFWWWI